jgi:hydrogenase-1 operon protein HyaF
MRMSRLADIPIRIEPSARHEPSAWSETPPAVGGLGGAIAAILSELATLLDGLLDAEVPGMIDLRSLPMSPLDRAQLLRVLGQGEVQATVNAEGLSMLRETGVSGVWWVEHFDPRGELIAELLEVTRVPQLLASASDEIAAGARTLRERITVPAQPLAEERHVPDQ